MIIEVPCVINGISKHTFCDLSICSQLAIIFFPLIFQCQELWVQLPFKPVLSSILGSRGMDRSKKIQVLAESIYEGFIKDDGGEWLSRTGKIIATNNLRAHKTRKAFQIVRAAADGAGEKRFWTKASLRDAVKKMMKDRRLQIPQTSGFSWPTWLKEQVSSLHELSQKARKNAWKMDYLQTVPWNPEDWGHWGFKHFTHHHMICSHEWLKDL